MTWSVEQQVELAQVTFARADLWAQTWQDTTPDKPLKAVGADRPYWSTLDCCSVKLPRVIRTRCQRDGDGQTDHPPKIRTISFGTWHTRQALPVGRYIC